MNHAECARCGTVWSRAQDRLWEQASWKVWVLVKVGWLSATITSFCARCGDKEPDYRKIREAHGKGRPPVCKLTAPYILSGGRSEVVTYEIVKNGAAIKCLCCGLTSHNASDVREAYCGFCHAYHSVTHRLAVSRA